MINKIHFQPLVYFFGTFSMKSRNDILVALKCNRWLYA